MKKVNLATLFVAVMFLAAVPGWAQLLNGGFETSDGGTGALNWGNWYNPAAGISQQRSTTVLHGGTASANTHLTLNASNDLGGWLQEITGWNVGDTINVSLWAKTDLSGGGYAQLGLEAVGSSGIIWGPSKGGVSDWSQLTQSITVPTGTTALKLIAFHANTANTSGDIWFDDASVVITPIPEASSLALLGAGLLGLIGLRRRFIRS